MSQIVKNTKKLFFSLISLDLLRVCHVTEHIFKAKVFFSIPLSLPFLIFPGPLFSCPPPPLFPPPPPIPYRTPLSSHGSAPFLPAKLSSCVLVPVIHKRYINSTGLYPRTGDVEPSSILLGQKKKECEGFSLSLISLSSGCLSASLFASLSKHADVATQSRCLVSLGIACSRY